MKSYECREEAWKFFYPAGNGRAMMTIDPVTGKEEDWILHHTDVGLKKNDPERYKQWRIEDLVMMKRKDHITFHNLLRGKHSPESRKKMSESQKGHVPWNKGLKGVYSPEYREKIGKGHRNKPLTDDQKAKISASLRKHFNEIKVLNEECSSKIRL